MDNVGYKRVIVISVISTLFIIIIDHYGVINSISDMVPGRG